MKWTPKTYPKVNRTTWFWLQCHWAQWLFKLATKTVNVTNFHKVWLRTVSTVTRKSRSKTSCSKVLTIGTFVQQIASRFTRFRCRYFCCLWKKTCPACSKEFFKTNGYYEEGLWFCSLGCCPNRDEIDEMFLEWAKDAKWKFLNVTVNMYFFVPFCFLILWLVNIAIECLWLSEKVGKP